MLKKVLQQDDLTTTDPDSVLFTSLLPLIYLNSLHVRARCCSVRRQYLRSQGARKPHLGHTHNNLEEARYQLRRSIEDAKDGLEQLTTYLCVRFRRSAARALLSRSDKGARKSTAGSKSTRIGNTRSFATSSRESGVVGVKEIYRVVKLSDPRREAG